MNVKYSKGAGEERGERVERVVDIHCEDTDRHVSTQVRGARTQKHLPAVQRNPFRAAALVLSLLSLLLVVGAIVLTILHISFTWENNKLSISYEELQSNQSKGEKNQTQENSTGIEILSKGDSQYQIENQTQCNRTEWKTFERIGYIKSTEMKNWTESRRDCQSRGADLVVINSKIEQDFVSEWIKSEAYWIGLEPVKEKQDMEWKWKWVDGSAPTFLAWQTGVTVWPVNGTNSRAYIDLEGEWNQTNGGSKRWICEIVIYGV